MIPRPKQEKGPKAQLAKDLRETFPRAVVFRIEDHFTHGVPDIVLTLGKTIWIEVKLADPDFKSKGIQELTMNRLALVGFAFYVVYYTWKGVERTYIVEPKDIGKSIDEWDCWVDGISSEPVIEYIRVLLK